MIADIMFSMNVFIEFNLVILSAFINFPDLTVFTGHSVTCVGFDIK